MEYCYCKKLKTKIVREELELDIGIKVKEIFIASSNQDEMKFYLEKANENHFTISESPAFSKTDDFSIYALTQSNNSVIKLDHSGYLSKLF